MDNISTETHEFRREAVKGDGSCLYSSVRFALKLMNITSNKCVRKLVADFIRRDKDKHDIILSDGYNTIEEYCVKIEESLWGGELEIRALAILYMKLVWIIDVTCISDKEEEFDKSILKYNETGAGLEFIVILYDKQAKHYDPLYMINKQNPNETLTIFKRDHPVVRKLLFRFIQGSLYKSNKSKQTSKTIVQIPISDKRKRSDHEDILVAQTTGKDSSLSAANKNYILDKPAKYAKLDTHEISALDNNSCNLMDIEQPLQKNISFDKQIQYLVTPIGQQSTTDVPGHTQDDDNLKYNRKSSADRSDHFNLNISIYEDDISANTQNLLEVFIIKEDIAGNMTNHLACKFEVELHNKQIRSYDRILVDLGDDSKKTTDSEGSQQIKFPLVDIFHSDNKTTIPKQIDNLGVLKQTSRRIGLRFKITRLSKQNEETTFHQHDSIQYIIQVYIENENSSECLSTKTKSYNNDQIQ